MGGPVYKAGSQAGTPVGGSIRDTAGSLSKTSLPDWSKGYDPLSSKTPQKDYAPPQIVERLKNDPYLPSAEAWEKVYGDWNASAYGFVKFARDAYFTARGKSVVDDMTGFFTEQGKYGPSNYSWQTLKDRAGAFFAPSPGSSRGPKPLPQF